jgi:hypothetical protein
MEHFGSAKLSIDSVTQDIERLSKLHFSGRQDENDSLGLLRQGMPNLLTSPNLYPTGIAVKSSPFFRLSATRSSLR